MLRIDGGPVIAIGALLTSMTALYAQPSFGPLAAAGYTADASLKVSPGQVINLFAWGLGPFSSYAEANSSAAAPAKLAGFSVKLRRPPSRIETPLPILSVWPSPLCLEDRGNGCAKFAVITTQLPFDMGVNTPGSMHTALPGLLSVSRDGGGTQTIPIYPVPDRVRVASGCDLNAPEYLTKYDRTCYRGPLVAHPDGSLVTVASPARTGEQVEISAYGLGATTPPIPTGLPTPSTTPLPQKKVYVAYELQPDAPPRNLLSAATCSELPTCQIVTATLKPGSVGLYLVPFVVPLIPAGTPACPTNGRFGLMSNLTVTILGIAPFRHAGSFDGAAVCASPR
jgi:hypothetical protein